MSVDFISDRAALKYLRAWALDEGTRIHHQAHLMIEQAFNQIDEQLWRLEELEK